MMLCAVYTLCACVCVCVLMLHYVCGVGEQSSLPVYRTLFLSTLNLSATPQGAHRLRCVCVCICDFSEMILVMLEGFNVCACYKHMEQTL